MANLNLAMPLWAVSLTTEEFLMVIRALDGRIAQRGKDEIEKAKELGITLFELRVKEMKRRIEQIEKLSNV